MNAELVRQVYVQIAIYPPDVAMGATIRAAQQEAVAAGHGLWAGSEQVVEEPPVGTEGRGTVVDVDTGQRCDPAYPDVCIQPISVAGDLDCKDVKPYARFRVLPPDPHEFDGKDQDGLGCEGN